MKLRKYIALGLVSIAALTGCGSSSQPQNETSTQNSEVEVEKDTEAKVGEEALRVVSGTVAATQVLDYLEADLVGVPTTSSKLPARYDGVPDVGMAMNPDLEKVVSLTPDLFVVDKNFKEKIDESASTFGLNMFYFDTTNYKNFITSIEELGKAVYKEENAALLVEELRKVETEITSKAEGVESPTVAVLFGASENFMLATETSYIGDLVALVGGENITKHFEEGMSSSYIQFSLEQIVEQNPDYILRFAHGNLEETKKSFDAFFEKSPAWSTLDAVKEGRVIDLDPSIFNVSANIYVKDAISTLGQIFYGE